MKDEIPTELLSLAAEGGEGNELAAKRRMRQMSRDQWRLLRKAVSRLDEWMDDVHLERFRARRIIAGSKEGR